MTTNRKVKSVAKTVIPKGDLLEKQILKTMKTISDIVGATLGPGGCPVLIERWEYGLGNVVTKDGVTAFKALGFSGEVEHAIMETARDASVRTAMEAGDGTTTATILAEAIVRYTHQYCKANPKVSSQRVVRYIEKVFRNYIEPFIKDIAIKPEQLTDAMVRAVAKCSANGDDELADAIMECFKQAGDDGNITIIEKSGPSGYQVEALKGYPVGIGFEDCVRRFFPKFINDEGNNRVYMEKPRFVLYFGTITEIQTLYPIMEEIGRQWEADKTVSPNVVVVACGFSESVLGHLTSNWVNDQTLNIFPLTIPKSPINNGEMHFLQDIQGVTGSTIFDPIGRPIEKGKLDDIGQPIEYFESHRYRSNLIGFADEGLLMARVEELQLQLQNPEGELEKRLIEERIGKLTGGIAKLTVIGASNGEVKEKRDRAEDAACAVRGARKHGCLPGAGSTLLMLTDYLLDNAGSPGFEDDVVTQVINKALVEPVIRLMTNAGLSKEEMVIRFNEAAMEAGSGTVWNGIDDTFVDAIESGIMDSTPAVLEAIRNSISIATLLGTLGGVIVFKRDVELERREASDTYGFLKDAGYDVGEQ